MHIGEVGQRPGPDVREIVIAHRPVTRAPHMRSTGLSTACARCQVRVVAQGSGRWAGAGGADGAGTQLGCAIHSLGVEFTVRSENSDGIASGPGWSS